MQYLKQLSDKASKIIIATEKYCDMNVVEEYFSSYFLWLLNSPVPSRPILERAWFEASVLAETSLFLVVHGFYEQACATLRMELDGFLTRLYWDFRDKRVELDSFYISDRLTNGYWEWERGEAKKYPNFDTIWRTFREDKYFKFFDDQHKLKVDIKNQNDLLHKYIHGRPQSRHSPGATRSSSINIKFEIREFNEWLTLFTTTYDLMTIMSVLLYPEYLKCKSGSEFIRLEPERMNQIHQIIDSVD